MSKLKGVYCGTLLALLCVSSVRGAVKILPIFSGGLFGGHSRFEGQSTAFKGQFQAWKMGEVRSSGAEG